MNSILITGATGFIGQHLLEDLADSPMPVRIITRELEKKIRSLPKPVQIFKADLNDYESLNKACEGIHTIVNIAAEVRNAGLITKTNIGGTQNLVNAAVKNNVKKIIHISSVGVVGANYQKRSVIIDEKSSCKPINAYEKSKLISENLFVQAQMQHRFDLDILRPTNVFGEYHSFNALLHLMKHLRENRLVMHTKNAFVNYVYVKDLTALIGQLINAKTSYGITNVGHSIELKAFYKLLKELLPSDSPILKLPKSVPVLLGSLGIHRLNAVSSGVEYSDSKLSGFFTYPHGLKRGIERTIEYYNREKLL